MYRKSWYCWGLRNTLLWTRTNYSWQLCPIDSALHFGRWVFSSVQKLRPADWSRWEYLSLIDKIHAFRSKYAGIIIIVHIPSLCTNVYLSWIAYDAIQKERGNYQALSVSRKDVLARVPQVGLLKIKTNLNIRYTHKKEKFNVIIWRKYYLMIYAQDNLWFTSLYRRFSCNSGT